MVLPTSGRTIYIFLYEVTMLR